MLLEKINSPRDFKTLGIADLKLLAGEIREFLITNVARTGGHLASNLGVVELTLAIHYVFDTPRDKLIWDVGHQSYVHKIITGRREQFPTLRQRKGLSGFPKPSESEYDTFVTGHSSTSLSLAAGAAVARDLKKESFNVISVIGDGALTGGMAFEGLNNIGHLQKDAIVVLNTNEMSISANVGALSKYFNRIITQKIYHKMKSEIEKVLLQIPAVGQKLFNLKNRFTEAIKSIFVPGMLFEELGFLYIGPDDGHDLDLLVKRMKKIREMKGRPILYHVITRKGRGYGYAENEPCRFHGIPRFNVETGETTQKGVLTFTDVFSETITRLAGQDESIIAVTAAMCEGTGLDEFRKKFPGRFFDVGIAEQHAVAFAASLARFGFKPAVAIYSTFLQRAYDQIIHDVAIARLNVKFFIDRSGLVGEDGETHQGTFDISYLRTVPGLVIFSPRNGREFMDMIHTALEYREGPACVRYPRCAIPEKDLDLSRPCEIIPVGDMEVLNKGEKAALLATGIMVENALGALDILRKNGLNPSLINLRCVKPLDEERLMEHTAHLDTLFILEENIESGGLGEYVAQVFARRGLAKKIKLINTGDRFVPHGPAAVLRDELGLSPGKIADAVMKEL